MIRGKTVGQYGLIERDCVLGMGEMTSECVDVVVTSPPYNLGIDYGKYDDRLPADAYMDWTRKWVAQVKRLLKPTGSFFLNLGSSPSNPLLPFQVALEISKTMALQNTFHWIKSISLETTDGEIVTSGHFKPINSQRFVTDCHEYVFHFTLNGDVAIDRLGIGVPYKHKSNIARWKHTKGADKRCRGNTWFIPYETIRERSSQRPHPATFPVGLARNCILLHGVRRARHVMDPFVGLGSSAVAAFECAVPKFTGFDIEFEYLDYARERLTNHAAPKMPLDLHIQRQQREVGHRVPAVRRSE